MFGNILGRKKDEGSKKSSEHSEIVNRVSKMNLTDMRAYLKDNMSDFKSCEDGVSSVMNRLLTKNAKTSKRYIESGDMDSKIKKGFEIVLTVASHKKITVATVEQIQEFIELYKDLIVKYDTDNKQIYASRLKDALALGVKNVSNMAEINRKRAVLGE